MANGGLHRLEEKLSRASAKLMGDDLREIDNALAGVQLRGGGSAAGGARPEAERRLRDVQ